LPDALKVPVVALDSDALEQARAIVDRERPTPQQEVRFEWTARLILVTLLLLAVWVATAITAFYQQIFLFAAALTCLTAITLFAFNARFVSRLWRSFWTAKRLGLHWRHTKRTSMQWAGLAFYAVIHLLVGYPLLFVGGSGVESAMERRDPVELLIALSAVSFAFGCLLLLPIEVVRGRVNAMGALRSTLDSSRPVDEGKVALAAREYDRITDLQFQHSVIDSHRSLANVRSYDADDLALRISPALQDAVAALPATQSDHVYDLIAELENRFVPSAAPGTDVAIPVPETKFQILVRWHPDRNEIEVVALEPLSPQGHQSHG
jgi:hypothetical protein